MTPQEFVARHRPGWARLEDLINRAGSLPPQDLFSLSRLYLSATAHLALAQRDWPYEDVTRYLNGLVARGHGRIYRGHLNLGASLRRFYGETLPRTYRSSWRFMLAAAALFFGPALIAFVVVVADPSIGLGLVPDRLVEGMRHHQLWTDIPPDERAIAAGTIMTNNIQVAIVAFAGGVLLTLPSVLVLVENGVNLGGVLGLTQVYGVSGGLLTFVSGHGPLELSVVVAAGGAGLQMGWSIVSPGRLRRADALKIAAGKAAIIAAGLAPVLIVAGLIEGNLSPSDAPVWIHAGVGLVTGTSLYVYLLGAGRATKAPSASGPDTARSDQG